MKRVRENEAKRFCFALSQGQGRLKWCQMVDVNNGYRHGRFFFKLLNSLRAISNVKVFATQDGRLDEHHEDVILKQFPLTRAGRHIKKLPRYSTRAWFHPTNMMAAAVPCSLRDACGLTTTYCYRAVQKGGAELRTGADQ